MAGASAPSASALSKGRIWQILWRRKAALLGLTLLVIMILAALFAPWVATHKPDAMRIAQRLKPPSGINFFGTDEFGRDLFSRVVYGGRISLTVGFLTVCISCVLGVTLGILAGFFKRLDTGLTRIIDAMMSFPDILLAIALVAVLGPSLVNVVTALGIVYTPRVARVVRASTLVIRELPFVEAARALGTPTWRILGTHVLCNLTSPIMVQATFIFAYAILAEAGLSFLGVGVSPEIPTWGTIISTGQQYAGKADWIMIFPGIAIVTAVFSLQMLGDALRDMLDPKLRKDL
ncbi:ABC transporter permease [Lacibacterium aquatile]|uniref:ABC transporter permease n=1 Tax=Lacibacterium aquatile TaxID=1168082 RepID=A0ABW5DVR2_9PROT